MEAVMHSATSAMQKMGTLRKITGRRRAPPEHMGDRAIARFQKYWSGLYDGPPLERTQGISLHLTNQEVKNADKFPSKQKSPRPRLNHSGNAEIRRTFYHENDEKNAQHDAGIGRYPIQHEPSKNCSSA